MTPSASALPVFDVLFFEHMPKTAGTTMQQLFRRRYRANVVMLTQVKGAPKRLDEMAAAIRAGHPPAAVFSHIGYGVHARLPETAPPLRYAHLTLLRDPIERAISSYYYYRQRGGVAAETTIAQFCSADGYPKHAYNMQTAFLGGLREEQMLDRIPFREEDYDEALLETAKRNLDAFAALGLVERFDESVLLFGRTLGWPLSALRFVSKNRGKRRPKALDLAPDDRAALEAANKLDQALYRHAEARFEALLAERVPDLEAQLRALGRLNRAYGPLEPLIKRLRPLTRWARRPFSSR